MDMRMHEVALDGTCGQSGSEIHEKEPKTVYKFLLFITYPCTAGGWDQVPWHSGLSQTYYTISRWGGDNYDCLSTRRYCVSHHFEEVGRTIKKPRDSNLAKIWVCEVSQCLPNVGSVTIPLKVKSEVIYIILFHFCDNHLFLHKECLLQGTVLYLTLEVLELVTSCLFQLSWVGPKW